MPPVIEVSALDSRTEIIGTSVLVEVSGVGIQGPPGSGSSQRETGTFTGNGSLSSFTINHKLGYKYVNISFFDADDEACVVEHWGVVDANNARAWFDSPLANGVTLRWVART